MQVTRENKDALNAVLNVQIVADDYKSRVEKVLSDYRKNANVPGFRKGLVPMGMIKKQYGKAILIDEVNKILQDSVNKYIQDEKLEILGNPLPVAQENIDWNSEEFNFQFELGFASEFDIDLASLKGVKSYQIVVDDQTIEKQIEDIAKRYGKLSSLDAVEEGATLSGKLEILDDAGEFVNSEIAAVTTSFAFDNIKGKRNQSKIAEAKVGDVVVLKTKSLFNNDSELAAFLNKDLEDVADLDLNIQFTVNEISKSEAHELNQELFDKIYGVGTVDSLEAFKAKIKEESEKIYSSETDRFFLNEVTEKLISDTKLELPKEFLTKWLRSVSENPITEDQARAEFEKSENGLKYQLIESKLFVDNKLQMTFEDIKMHAVNLIKSQMAQFGQMNMDDKEAEGIAMRVLQNQDEYTRISEQVKMEKLLTLYKDKVKATTKKLTFDKFVEELSKK